MKNREYMTRSTEFRAEEKDGERYIEGYFAVFDGVYEISDRATESIGRNAFDDALDDDVRVLVNHDTTLVLGRTSAGTAELKVDERGLWGRVRINAEDSDAVNAWARTRRGDVDQASFGFDILEEVETRTEKGTHWTITRIKLYEVSLCTFPAYETTELSARSAERSERRKKNFENWKTEKQEVMKTWH